MLFDFTDLRLFLNIAEFKSLTRSAEQMHLSLPAASNRIKELESRFGTRLIYRENKGMTLSPAGQVLLCHAQQFMQQLERLKGEMQQFNNGIKGFIRIFANTTAVTEFMPEVMGAFLSKYPHVNVSLEERFNQDIVRGVHEGTADIGIVAGPVSTGGLETITFAMDRLVLTTPTDHPLAAVENLSFAEMLDYPHIGLYEGSTLHFFLSKMASECGRTFELRIQVRSFESMCRMVERHAGIAILPYSAALRLSQTMKIKLVELTEPWAIRKRAIVVQKLDALPQHTRELVDFICTSQGSKSSS
jgi:DNA-binding transcriptional LysR family regulator